MVIGPREPACRQGVPPPQGNIEEAAARALVAVRKQPAGQLEWLGARRNAERWAVAVLDDLLTIELDGGTVRTSAGRGVGPWWRILTLHYLATEARPPDQTPAVTFADLPGGRSYAPVYQGRVISRLCASAGRGEQTIRQACEALGGRAAPGGDLAFDFQVYPRVPMRLVWHAGDEELSPSATLLLPASIEAFFCLEDIVVLSERLVSRLSGGAF